MTNGEDVGGELRKAPVRNSSSPSSKPHRAALSAARSLMELWLPAWIDHRAIRLKNSQFQQIRPQTVVYVSTDADWRSIMPGRVRPGVSVCVCVGADGVCGGKTDGQGRQTQGGQRAVNHTDKSEHRGHYITSSLRGEGCMLMTL